ncbi:MAG TPA: magnesium transporter CorA family protein [Spirochaetota bacterium]|nr:magnesium transporter CorA family protein [Spirochaetota bacterium]HXK64701.1 magnesium transporter CorA family protein [Spirochaetota bacterium]
MVQRYKFINENFLQNDCGNIVVYSNPNESEISTIASDFGIDIHSVHSALDIDELSRFEIEKDYIVLIWKIPTNMKINELSSLNVITIGFFIKDSTMIIISPETLTYIHEKVHNQIESLFDALFHFQHHTIKHFTEHLKIIKMISKEIQNKINKSIETKHLVQMFNLSEKLIYYLHAIDTNITSLEKLRSYLITNNQRVNFDFLNDIIIDHHQAKKQAEIYTEVFAGLMDARGSIVNNNMNILIKNLTKINVIFLPLNLIAGIFGMSEYSMMTQGIPWYISYGFFAILIMFVSLLLSLLLNKYDERWRR